MCACLCVQSRDLGLTCNTSAYLFYGLKWHLKIKAINLFSQKKIHLLALINLYVNSSVCIPSNSISGGLSSFKLITKFSSRFGKFSMQIFASCCIDSRAYPYSSCLHCNRHSLSICCYSNRNDNRNIDRRLYAGPKHWKPKIKSKTQTHSRTIANYGQKKTTKMMQHFYSFHRLFTCLTVWFQYFYLSVGLLVYGLIHSIASCLAGDLSSYNALNNKKRTCFLCVILNV